MWSLSEVLTVGLCVKENMNKPAELSAFKDVWSGQSGWRFGREMRLNVRLCNMLCCFLLTVGLAGPLENRVQMFYLTEEPKYTLSVVSGWRSCFFWREANLMGEAVMMSAITGSAMTNGNLVMKECPCVFNVVRSEVRILYIIYSLALTSLLAT